MAAIVALVAATKNFGIINIWKRIARNHRTQFPSRSIKSALINHLPVAKTLRQQAADLRRALVSGLLLFRRVFFTRTGIHPRIKSEGMLRSKTL
jgi:hypothetical protein